MLKVQEFASISFIKLSGMFFVLLVSGCSFDSVFFPLDERPDDTISTNVETISLTASDGVTIIHFLFKPLRKHKATIVVFQGSGSTVANWHSVIHPLIDDGYQVFMMEYRGFGESGGEASHLSVAHDANNAVAYLKTRNDVINDCLMVLGQSYGGQLAIYVAHRNQDIVNGLITEGTFTSFSDEAAYSSPWFFRPLVQILFADPYRAEDLIADIDMSKLIIHSSDDNTVPIEMAKVLFANAKGDKELWEVTGEHVAALIDMPSEYVSKINEVLVRSCNKALQ